MIYNKIMTDPVTVLKKNILVKGLKAACALGVVYEGNSCLDKDDQKFIVTKLKIENYEDVFDKTNCNDEKCVLTHPLLKNVPQVNQLLKLRIKAIGPAGDTTLINNYNIHNVFEQLQYLYNKKHKDYFMGYPFQYIDFPEYPNSDVIKYPINMCAKKYKTCAVIINTDLTGNKGKHWFTLFGDFRTKRKTLEYFNSSGLPPKEPFSKWIVNYAEKNGFEYVPVNQGFRHQYENTECGMYSLSYIILRLNEKGPENLDSYRSKRLPDNIMVSLRKVLFRDY